VALRPPPDAPSGKILTYLQVLAYTYIPVKFHLRSSVALPMALYKYVYDYDYERVTYGELSV